MIYDDIQAEYTQMETQIGNIESQLKTLPKGNMFCSRNGKHYKWYMRDGKKQIYIPKKNRKLAEQLAYKKYLLLLLEDLKQEKRALDFYLRHRAPFPGKSSKLLTEIPEYQKLLAPYFQPISQELSQWMFASYEQNPQNPERLIHKSSSGHYVRSKSEILIDMSLYLHKIPFRYECALHLAETTLFPDFTIRHPETGKIYYWEHFGLMDNPQYRKAAFSKLQLYADHGLIPSIQLITTYETKKHPLGPSTVEQLIQSYFL